MEEEGRLSNPVLREHFVERVFAYWRLRGLLGTPWTLGARVRADTAHQLILMAHSPDAYRRLGRLVTAARSAGRKALDTAYPDGFMAALSVVATRSRHTNVLQHMAGYFKKPLDPSSKEELLAIIEHDRRGRVPLIVPNTLIRHYVRVPGTSYLAGQLYLEPHRNELLLRDHV
jgi:uncharacterized protein YbgA (DUF1722 family)